MQKFNIVLTKSQINIIAEGMGAHADVLQLDITDELKSKSEIKVIKNQMNDIDELLADIADLISPSDDEEE